MSAAAAPHPPAYENDDAGVLVHVTADAPTTAGKADVLVTLTPPKHVGRVPIDVCCVVDGESRFGFCLRSNRR